MRLVFILFLLFSSTASANWSGGDTSRQAVFTVLQAADWAQTREIVKDDSRYELNPILGKYPSNTEVDIYFAATTVGHYLVSRALPPKQRKVWQYVWIGAQAGNVVRNYQVGIRINW